MANYILEKIKSSLNKRSFSLQPVQIADQLKKEAENKKKIFSTGVYVPDTYEISLSDKDLKEFSPFLASFKQELLEELKLFFKAKGFVINAPEPTIELKPNMVLEPGTIRISSSTTDSTPDPLKAPSESLQVTLKVQPGTCDEKTICLGQGTHTLGRGHAADVRIEPEDRLMSKIHCAIEVNAAQVILTDLSSSNGTFIDKTRIISETIIASGTIITVGRTDIEVVY
ncbi:MAG: FhaA domain-containing protein [Pseudomonadota bacterium]